MTKILLTTAAILLIALCAALCFTAKAHLGPVTNIDGIPYPVEDGKIVVTEKLAHADVYLTGPLIAKELKLTVTFAPLRETELRVGIRENPFWLSYSWHSLYQREHTASPGTRQEEITRTITIPLTDKLPDRDGSLDLMFLAGPGTLPEDDPTADTTVWYIHRLSTEVSHEVPGAAALKDYLRRLVTHEVPL